MTIRFLAALNRPRAAVVAVLGVYLGIVCAATTRANEQDKANRPNILLLVSDDQRPDTLGILDKTPIETPHLDELARRGTLFTRAVCANPICTPSRAEILTGCSGFRNGVLDFSRVIDERLPTWAATMRQAGYHTWYVGKWHNDGKPVLRGYEGTRGLYSGGGGKWWKPQRDAHGREVTGYRGWIFQDDEGNKFPDKGVGLTPNISSHFADAAIELIGRETEQPFFLHVNFTAPHDPLLLPPGFADKYDPDNIPLPRNFQPEHPFDHGNFRGRDEKLLPWPRTTEDVRADLAAYYAVISHMDQQIGRILSALRTSGKADNTVVIFTSDHGLAMGSHGLRGKQSMYEHTIGVPLVIAGPELPAGRRSNAQTYLRDLYPTVCELSGVSVPESVEGRSLKPVLQGRSKQIYPFVFCYFRDVQRMIRDDRWKLIHYPKIDRYQLFDLRDDPDELRDLANDQRFSDRLRDLQAKLVAEQRRVRDPLLVMNEQRESKP